MLLFLNRDYEIRGYPSKYVTYGCKNLCKNSYDYIRSITIRHKSYHKRLDYWHDQIAWRHSWICVTVLTLKLKFSQISFETRLSMENLSEHLHQLLNGLLPPVCLVLHHKLLVLQKIEGQLCIFDLKAVANWSYSNCWTEYSCRIEHKGTGRFCMY